MNEYTQKRIAEARKYVAACDNARDVWVCRSQGAQEAEKRYQDAVGRLNLLLGKTGHDVLREKGERLFQTALAHRYELRVDHQGFIWYASSPVSFGREDDFHDRLVSAGYFRIDSANDRARWIPPKVE